VYSSYLCYDSIIADYIAIIQSHELCAVAQLCHVCSVGVYVFA